MILDKLQNSIKSLFFYLILTIICISLFPIATTFMDRLPEQNQNTASLSDCEQTLDALLKPMTVTTLQQPLPQGYRVEMEDGEILFVSPAVLLSALLEDEIQSMPSGWKEQPAATQAILMRIIGLHSALLEKMGDRSENMTDEELNNSCWLTAQDCTDTARPLTSEDISISDSILETAANCACRYFLSNDGNIAGQCGSITVRQIYDRLQNGETPSQIWSQLCGDEYQLESAQNQ